MISFYSLIYIHMVAFIVWFIAWWILFYFVWWWTNSSKMSIMEADMNCLKAELNWQHLSRKAQEKMYDDLYDAFLRVNKHNTELQKKLDAKSRTYEDMSEIVYNLFKMWSTRRELSVQFDIPYSTMCRWISNKILEDNIKGVIDEVNSSSESN